MVKKKKTVKPDLPTPLLEVGYADRAKLMTFPWPWKDASVEEMKITDVMAFVPAKIRPVLMDELYRVLTPEGKATITVVYYSQMAATSDFRLEWPPLSEQSFMYFNREWRNANQVDWPMKCDFDFSYGYSLLPDLSSRAQEVQSFQIKSYLNTVQRLHVVLTKRKTQE